MNTRRNTCKKIALSMFFLLVLCRTAGAQDARKGILSAADAGTCTTDSTACLFLAIPSGSGGATFTITANASGNTIQFEATGDTEPRGSHTWVALSVFPSNATTSVTSTTSTGTWQANVAGFTQVRLRMSTFVGGTTTTYINLSTASARVGGGGGLPTGCTSPGPGAITCTNNVLAANLPPALPTTPNGVSFVDTSTPAGGVGVAPVWSWPGVPGRSNAGATDAIVATDRGAGVLETNGGAVAVSLPQAGTTNFANNFDFFIKCATTTVCTITPAAGQIAGNNGTLGATLVMPASSTAYCYSLDNANYQCGVVSSGTGTVTTTGSPANTDCAIFSAATSITGIAGCTIDASGNLTAVGSLTQAAGAIITPVSGNGPTLRPLSGAVATIDSNTNSGDGLNIRGGHLYISVAGSNSSLFSVDSATGKFQIYDGLTNVGVGIPPILGIIHSTSNTAAITTATLCGSAATACGNAGMYTVEWGFTQTGTACGTPGAGGVTFLLTWTDFNGTAHSAISLAMDDSASLVATTGTFHFTNSNATAWASGQFNISSNGSILQYATGYTACGVGTGSYELDVSVTRRQ